MSLHMSNGCHMMYGKGFLWTIKKILYDQLDGFEVFRIWKGYNHKRIDSFNILV